MSIFFIDYAELATQIWATYPHSARWWSTENDHHSFFFWDTIHSSYCIPEWRGNVLYFSTIWFYKACQHMNIYMVH